MDEWVQMKELASLECVSKLSQRCCGKDGLGELVLCLCSSEVVLVSRTLGIKTAWNRF